MLAEQQLLKLIKNLEALCQREANTSVPKKGVKRFTNLARAEPIINYLLEPYENGYWELKATWNSASPYAIYLLETLEMLNELEAKLTPGTDPYIFAKNLEDDKRQELLRITNRLTPIHILFFMIANTSNEKKFPTLPLTEAWIKRINLAELKSKFSSAWTIFEEQIYFDDFFPVVSPSWLSIIKTGAVGVLDVPSESGAITLIGTQRGDVCTMQDFYTALGVIKESSIRRVFAPDEDLFKPYFSLVSNVLPHIIRGDEQTSKVFSQALSYYEEKDFQHCISTLGLIAENYLQRIYTSLLREQISGGLTLGQTIDRIHKGIDELFPSSKTTQRTLDSAYQKITALDPATPIDSIKPFLRELVAMIGEDRQHYGKRFDELHKPPARRNPFPSRIYDNLNELLKWRNAAAHNSRISLGKHEADRTLYCLISLISWWQKQIDTIDWTKTKLEIIETLLSKAKTAPAK